MPPTRFSFGAQQTPFEIDSPTFRSVQDGTIAETTDNVAKVIASFPIDVQKIAYIEIFLVVIEQTFSAGAAVQGSALFGRVAGNLIRITNPTGSVIATTFTAPQPFLDVVANTTTQSIDVVITGKTGMTLRWFLETKLRVTT